MQEKTCVAPWANDEQPKRWRIGCIQYFMHVFPPVPMQGAGTSAASSALKQQHQQPFEWTRRPVTTDARCLPSFLLLSSKLFAVIGTLFPGTLSSSINAASAAAAGSSMIAAGGERGGGSGLAASGGGGGVDGRDDGGAASSAATVGEGCVALFAYDGRSVCTLRTPRFRSSSVCPAHFALSNDAFALVERGSGGTLSNFNSGASGRTVYVYDVRSGRQLGHPITFSAPVVQIGLSQGSTGGLPERRLAALDAAGDLWIGPIVVPSGSSAASASDRDAGAAAGSGGGREGVMQVSDYDDEAEGDGSEYDGAGEVTGISAAAVTRVGRQMGIL